MHPGDDPKPNILDVSDRYKVRTPCPSRGWRLQGSRRCRALYEGMSGKDKRKGIKAQMMEDEKEKSTFSV